MKRSKVIAFVLEFMNLANSSPTWMTSESLVTPSILTVVVFNQVCGWESTLQVVLGSILHLTMLMLLLTMVYPYNELVRVIYKIFGCWNWCRFGSSRGLRNYSWCWKTTELCCHLWGQIAIISTLQLKSSNGIRTFRFSRRLLRW